MIMLPRRALRTLPRTPRRPTGIDELRDAAQPLTGAPVDFDAIIRLAADRDVVLIGEASHGTHEFYRIRAEITKRLIRELGFAAVAIEGDWPDAYRVNRFVRGSGVDQDAEDALGGFTRFPQWMWRNADVLDFVGWLRAYNDRRPGERGVGFYGLDLYSLHASIEAVVTYLHTADPEAAMRAARRYACFDGFGGDPQRYGYAVGVEREEGCRAAVIQQLVELNRNAADYIRRDGRNAEDAQFFAEQNAKVVVDAEHYYRVMYEGGPASWNLRDQHMTSTLTALREYLDTLRRGAKIVVWAHNSHLGDARATEMAARGEVNVGQLVREGCGNKALLVGFTTYDGSVTAASDWERPAERKAVRPALPDSYEAMFHDVGPARFLLDMTHDDNIRDILELPRLERFIGVIYRPKTERMSHYFHASLPSQFDVVLHYDRTRAVEPLERTPKWTLGEEVELPETYPSAL